MARAGTYQSNDSLRSPYINLVMKIITVLLVGLLVSCTQTEVQAPLEVSTVDTLFVTDSTIYWNEHMLINESP